MKTSILSLPDAKGGVGIHGGQIMNPMTQMEAEMKLRNFSPRTQREYLRVVRVFSAHFVKPPERLGTEQVREYLLDLRDRRQLSPSTLKVYRAALRFFYENAQGRPEVVAPIGSPKVPRRIPQVLSGTEVEGLFGAIGSLKYRAVVMTTYAAGLRISEACQLEPCDIDSSRMLLHVRHGKGGENRFLMLSPRLLEALRAYWRAERPRGRCLFPGAHPDRPLSPESVRRVIKKALVLRSINTVTNSGSWLQGSLLFNPCHQAFEVLTGELPLERLCDLLIVLLKT